ncbi:MAG: type II secretion system protein M [Xanthomonadales bacterium]|nr:type II secretion system protein M [Xanthomonadales bacterium]MBK7144642.1 type II secretion system protein M [Xanthomonadales bacterium]MCC6560863.1 type II secretion system protein M [Xanthomonadales bacterium]
MSAWWSALAERDRRFLSIGAAIVALLLFWALWFDPLRVARASLADSVQQGEADLVYMQAAAQRLATLQSGGSASVFDRGGRSLLALADASAREAQLANALKRIEPVSSGRVAVSLEAASFDAMAGWLEQLQQRYGVRAEEFSINRAAGIGQVDARVVLVDPAE